MKPIDVDRLAIDLAYWFRNAPETAEMFLPGRGWLRTNGDDTYQKWVEGTWKRYDVQKISGWELQALVHRPELPETFVGQRVRYTADTSRKGWKGVVDKENRVSTDVDPRNKIRVRFDSGTTQWYSRCALTGEPRFYGEFGEPEIIVYLQPIEDKPMASFTQHDPEYVNPKYIVRGVRGGPEVDFFDSEAAHKYAREKAQDSKSGQAYRVFKAVTEYRRQEPPIVRTDLS